MLIVDENLLEVDAAVDQVVAEFLALPQVANYRSARQAFLTDQALQEKIKQNQAQQDYAAFRPEIRALQHEINQNAKVYALRLAENDLQEILSDLTKKLAGAISETIFVDENLPLRGGDRHARHHRHD